MKAVVIGATGHVGTYLVPRLVRMGYEVTAISRGLREPYTLFPEWNEVQRVQLDRLALEKTDGFGCKIAAMNPDIVIDMVSYDYRSTMETVEALKNTNLSQYIFISSIREHGASFTVPADESMPRRPISPYGHDKLHSVTWLHEQYIENGFPYTGIMPGHITGPGWNCVNPTGNFDPEIFGKIGRGERIYVPNFGVEPVHHVHADDVAQMIELAIRHRDAALDEDFLTVSHNAITLRGFAEAMYAWFGKEENIEYVPYPQWRETASSEKEANYTLDHIIHCNSFSWEKAHRILGYTPQYTSLDAVYECVKSMIERGVIRVG